MSEGHGRGAVPALRIVVNMVMLRRPSHVLEPIVPTTSVEAVGIRMMFCPDKISEIH
jgi:hypothetical protein